MTTPDRHEPAAQRALEALGGPVAGVTGTSVPRHSDPIHDHYDQAHALGYLRGYADGREDGRLVGLDAAREAVAALDRWDHNNYALIFDPHGWAIDRDDALAAIDKLKEEQK